MTDSPDDAPAPTEDRDGSPRADSPFPRIAPADEPFRIRLFVGLLIMTFGPPFVLLGGLYSIVEPAVHRLYRILT